MSNTPLTPDEFWGNLRSLVHARDIDIQTLTQLTSEFLEHASEEVASSAKRYIEDHFKLRRVRHEVEHELASHHAPSGFGSRSAQAIDFVDEGLTLTPVDNEDDWADEYERYEFAEEREWAAYEVVSIHDGPEPLRLLADLETMGGVHFVPQLDADGELLEVTCHISEEFTSVVTWRDDGVRTQSVHVRCEREFEELCFD